MTELTYKDYIKYLNIKMGDFKAEELLPDERRYFNLIMEQLSDAPDLPEYILNEPLISSQEYDKETLVAIDNIKETISPIMIQLKTSFLIDRIKNYIFVRLKSINFAGISIILLFIGALSVLFSTIVSGSNIGTNSPPLIGVAGSGSASTNLVALIVLAILFVFLFTSRNKK